MKPATAKAKGRQVENELCEWIRSQGYDAERRRLNGSLDRGDINVGALPNLCIEVKSGAGSWKMTAWIKQTLVEMKNAEATTGLLAIRPARARNIHDWLGVALGNVHITEDPELNMPPTVPWPHAHALSKANKNHVFQRAGVTIGCIPQLWYLLPKANGRTGY